MDLKKLLLNIPDLPQRQDSTQAQLQDLHAVANKLGFYDAADAIKPLAFSEVFEDSDLKKAAQLPGVARALQVGNKVLAIKEARTAFGWSLKTAKDVMDKLFDLKSKPIWS